MSTQVLNNDEAAALIGVTPKTLRFWRHKGRGSRFIKFGESKASGVGYDIADIEAWKEARKFSSTTQCSPAARLSAGLALKRTAGATG